MVDKSLRDLTLLLAIAQGERDLRLSIERITPYTVRVFREVVICKTDQFLFMFERF